MGEFFIIKDGKEIKRGKAPSLDYIKIPKGAVVQWVADEDWGRTPEKKNKYNSANNGD